jgi:release factor glutamine methyltransferase
MNSVLPQPAEDWTIDRAIRLLVDYFSFSQTPRLDAQVLLSHILDKPKAWLLAHRESLLTPDQHLALTRAASEIKKGVPLPYVVGHWSFYGLDFLVTPAVLIPRPETELLVEHAQQWLQNHPHQRSLLDIGTGSGCIAISLAVHIPDLIITATDISQEALQVARSNACKHRVDYKITFARADLFTLNPATASQLRPPFDIITANLPYIPTTMLTHLEVFEREPTLALDGGSDGLELIRRFLAATPPYLSPSGQILLEIEARQGKTGLKLAQYYFPQAETRLFPDLSGKDRLLIIDA